MGCTPHHETLRFAILFGSIHATRRRPNVSHFCLRWPHIALVVALAQALVGHAQDVPAHAQGLTEELVSVDLSDRSKQVGVYSIKTGAGQPSKLAVLLPGYPSVVRPVVENGVMTASKLTGNFLIRARRFLVNDSVASLIVDCPSERGDTCASGYQASKQRQDDIDQLIAEVKRRAPSITEVWLVGTSMGTISSSFMPTHNPKGYAGAIHTAAITDPYAKNAYRELGGFDYAKSGVPQFFVHHSSDPCPLTTYASARAIADKFKAPLVIVSGGTGFQGPACEAFTEHGFRGKEKEVMNAVAAIIKTGKATQLEIN